ncbi:MULTISPECIES: TonB-dependent receptor domain-containing protein [Acinetobacter]|uniref:TonB-dependent receptor domain-containing protein n=1 Tax=Acinetobacter TaxID=469 RepID=UPI000C2417A8|nr:MULTISPECIES: TonB-dependent receptor [Acinetobacter]PJI35345.1 TonB-dependent receptor [Acinetobacter pseudolwoffii]
MRNFNLRPLAVAILGVTAASAHAETNNTTVPVTQLSTIVVSAAGYEQKIKDAPASITVLTEEDFKTKRITSLADALSDVEGIDISPTAGKTGGLDISIRGLPSEYTLVLIDGRRQNSTGDITPNGFGETKNNFIPPLSAIERIEIIRGPASTLYGSDAMGGVVNIITKKVADTWTGSVTLDGTLNPNYSDFGNQRSIDFYGSGPLVQNLLGLQIRAKHWERDESNVTRDIDQTTLGTGNNPSEGKIDTLGARLTLTPTDKHDISIDAESQRQSYENPKNTSGFQLGTVGPAGGYDNEMEFNRDKYVLAHQWRNDIGTLDSSITRNESETVGRLIPSRMQGGDLVTKTPRLIESEDTIFDTKLSVNSIANHNLILGGQWWDASISDGLRSSKPEVNFTQVGLFAEDTWNILPNFALTLGLRYDDHDTFGDFITPRAYAVWNVNDTWTLKGGYSEGYKAPRLEQLTNGVVNVGRQGAQPIFGNQNLKPETSDNYELGIYFTPNNDLNINLTGFISTVEDKIVSGAITDTSVNTGGNPGECLVNQTCADYLTGLGTPWQWLNQSSDRAFMITRPDNVDEVEIYGTELGINWGFAEDWKLNFNYTWTETEVTKGKDKGKKLQDTPEHMFNATVKWNVADNADLWLRGEYRTERSRFKTTNLTGDDLTVYNTLGDYEAYGLMHLGTNYAVNDNWDIGVALYNIFDKDFNKYEIVDGTAYNLYSNTQEGRRVQLSTTFKF